MKSISLNSHLETVTASNPERIAVSSPHQKVSYRSISNASWHNNTDSAIIVYCEDIVNFVRALVALDGCVEYLCPISTRLNTTDFLNILKQHNFSHILTDLPIETTTLFSEVELTVLSCSELESESADNIPMDYMETTWLVPTSGTTSSPKLVFHSLDSLASTALQKRQPEALPQVWALFYDFTRYAGYQVLFQALLGGHTLVVPEISKPMHECVQFCLLNSVTHISATATLWRKILMCPGSENLNLKNIVLGGEAADKSILFALSKTFPNARITHVYASTEAGVGISVSDGKAGFPLSFLENNAAAVQIAIHDDHLFLRSSGAGQSYAGEKELLNDEGWINTGDLVNIENDRFHIIGRASGVLNIGGDKVFPEKVRHILLEHEEIIDACVYGKKNPFTGTLVVADIKLRNGINKTTIKTDIENFLKEKLSTYQRPRILRFVDEIETNLTGKMVKKNEH